MLQCCDAFGIVFFACVESCSVFFCLLGYIQWEAKAEFCGFHTLVGVYLWSVAIGSAPPLYRGRDMYSRLVHDVFSLRFVHRVSSVDRRYILCVVQAIGRWSSAAAATAALLLRLL